MRRTKLFARKRNSSRKAPHFIANRLWNIDERDPLNSLLTIADNVLQRGSWGESGMVRNEGESCVGDICQGFRNIAE
jgi:hypothetical protein